MNPEFGADRMFTPAQLENQRLFRVGPSQLPEQGDKAKRVWNKFQILTGATVADLVESWGAEKLLGQIKPRMVDATLVQRRDPEALRKSAFFSGIGFIEDMVSDELYVVGMNSILRGMTGLEDVSYASPTAKFISGWTNLGSYASGKFAGLEQFWKKPWNVVNAVNVEAGLGLLEELPLGIGNVVAWAHSKVDETLQKSELVQFGNLVATAAVTGYHIDKNMVNASK